MPSPDRESNLTGVDSGAREPGSASRAEGLYAKGLEYFDQSRYSEAIEEFEQALKLNAQHPGANKHMGLALFRLGEFNSSVKYFNQTLQDEPENEQILCYLGLAYLELKHYDEAER